MHGNNGLHFAYEYLKLAFRREHKIQIPFLIRLFWSLWFTLVTISNVLDGLQEIGMLPSGLAFVSGNFKQIFHTTSIYQVPNVVNTLLFSGVIGWEMICTYLFWRSLLGKKSGDAVKAFTSAIELFSSFILASELFLDYAVESKHILVLILLIVSYMVCGKEHVFR